MKSKGDQIIEKNFKIVKNVKEWLKILDKKDISVKKKKPYKPKKLTKKQIEAAKKKVSDTIKPLNLPKQNEVKNDYPADEDIYAQDLDDVKIKKRYKRPYERAYTSVLPAVYEELDYTPNEIWKKFCEYTVRAWSKWENITISWFQVFASVWRNYLNKMEKSQVFGGVVDYIYQSIESFYEDRIANWDNLSYIMNNRFKGKWESNQKVETTQTVLPEIKDILDWIIYGKNPDGTPKRSN